MTCPDTSSYTHKHVNNTYMNYNHGYITIFTISYSWMDIAPMKSLY